MMFAHTLNRWVAAFDHGGGYIYHPDCVPEVLCGSGVDNQPGTILRKSHVTDVPCALLGRPPEDRFLAGVEVIQGDHLEFGGGRQKIANRRKGHSSLER